MHESYVNAREKVQARRRIAGETSSGSLSANVRGRTCLFENERPSPAKNGNTSTIPPRWAGYDSRILNGEAFARAPFLCEKALRKPLHALPNRFDTLKTSPAVSDPANR